MGNTATDSAPPPPLRIHQNKFDPKLHTEIIVKRNERTAMLIGNHRCGKTELVRQIVDLHSSTMDRSKFLRSRYELELFTVSESTDPCMPQYAAKSFKYLDAIHQHPECYKRTAKEFASDSISAASNLQTAINEQQATRKEQSIDSNNAALHTAYFELAVFGFVHRHQHPQRLHLPFDIIELILMYFQTVPNSLIRSYKLQINSNVWQLLCVSGDDFIFDNCSQLLPWVHRIVFVIDLLAFNKKYHQTVHHANVEATQFVHELVICRACIDYARVYGFHDVLSDFVVVMTNKQEFQQLVQDMSAAEFLAMFNVNGATERYGVALEFLTKLIQRNLDVKLQCFAMNTFDKDDVYSFCHDVW